MDPDTAIFVIDLQDANSFSASYFLKVNLHQLSKIKSQTEATKQQESRFVFLFLLDDPQHWYRY
jgi:hypothetical protein